MNKRLKKRWLEALRSGKYKQSRGQFKVTEEEHARQVANYFDKKSAAPVGYCCLGVLCEISPKLKKLVGPDWEDEGRFDRDAAAYAGLSDDLGYAQDTLIDLNDQHRKSFKQIANWIEKNL